MFTIRSRGNDTTNGTGTAGSTCTTIIVSEFPSLSCPNNKKFAGFAGVSGARIPPARCTTVRFVNSCFANRLPPSTTTTNTPAVKTLTTTHATTKRWTNNRSPKCACIHRQTYPQHTGQQSHRRRTRNFAKRVTAAVYDGDGPRRTDGFVGADDVSCERETMPVCVRQTWRKSLTAQFRPDVYDPDIGCAHVSRPDERTSILCMRILVRAPRAGSSRRRQRLRSRPCEDRRPMGTDRQLDRPARAPTCCAATIDATTALGYWARRAQT